MRLPSRPFANQGGVVILAHRGFSGLYPENTLLAFEKAAELPIDGLELDIHATRDGVLVVSHDDSVDRMTNGQGKIQNYTLNELNQLDAGYRFTLDEGQTYPFRGQGLTIPTLEEVFQRFTALWINVDIKAHDKNVVENFCDLISKYDAHQRLCVGSTSTKIVKYLRKICPQVVSIASLVEVAALLFLSKFYLERFYNKRYLVQASPQESRWGISLDIVTRRFIVAAHRRETAVHIWTLNELTDMQRFIDWGIDGIITDYPDRALTLLGRIPTKDNS